MRAIADTWNHTAGANRVVRFIDMNLRGAGQVMLQNNPLTGFLFIVGIAWAAIDANSPEVAIGAVVALMVATVTAMLLNVDQPSLRNGLYGFNGMLVGAAVPTFIDIGSVIVWAFVVVGAAVSTIAMLAIAKLLSTWGVPALTFPFVLTTWFLLLGSYSFANIDVASLSDPALPTAVTASAAAVSITPGLLLDTLFRNTAQIFLINNAVTGVIFVIALALSSRWAAGFALIGSAIALAASLALGAAASDITAGLFGFSGVLTAIALGSAFYKPGWRVLGYVVLGTIFTVIAQGAMNTLLAPVGIPPLTAPFVVVTWLFLIPHEQLSPISRNDLDLDRGEGDARAATDGNA